MRCPKCQYISFDSGDRCRNCGYEFSLSPPEPPPVDVTIARDDLPSGRSADSVLDALDASLTTAADGEPRPRADRLAPSSGGRPMSASDLPLFIESVADDQAPLVTPPAVPRQPLSVRRASAARARERDPEPMLELAGEPSEPPVPTAPIDAELPGGASAGIARRIVAGVIDLLVLGPILATVVYLTLRALDLQYQDWRMLPMAPLVAFLLLLCGGYFILFTAAGGQTIGKMAARIRVVSAPAGGDGPLRVSFGAALIRSVVCLGSVLLLGAGFLPVLFSADRRALHDRVAETRVVPA